MEKREQPAFRCDLHVLKDVNLEVAEGEKLVIIGPSGSGKSTTVRCMNFLEEPTSGHVYIDGQELTAKNKTKLVRETTSALDPETIQEVLDVMVRLAHEKKHHHGGGHPRDGFCPAGGRPRSIYGRRPDLGRRHTGALLHQS